MVVLVYAPTVVAALVAVAAAFIGWRVVRISQTGKSEWSVELEQEVILRK